MKNVFMDVCQRLCLPLTAAIWPLLATAQVDNFNSGSDTNWTHLDLNSGTGGQLPGATFSFPSDGFGGKAYRIQAPAPPVPDAGPARAFSYRKDVTYADFYVAMDIVTWNNTVNQAFGFLVRAGSIGLGQTTGYVMNYDPNQHSGGHGQFQINRIDQESPTTICAANVTLDPTHRYRFVMTGDTNGVFTGRVFDLADLTAPIATIEATDTTYPSGYIGVFNFSRVNQPDYTNTATGFTDSTFDNYIATTLANAPTNLLAFPATPASVPGWPQVVNRSPAADANFYPAASGLTFTASTLSTNAVLTNAIHLLLNGTDVSSSLVIGGSATNATVAFNGLESNAVYNASIILSNATGQATTNTFAFDTFSEAFLDSPGVKVVEVEDYNYSGGQFQDNPPPSGLDVNGNQINGNGVGYYNLIGTNNVDYFTTAAPNANYAYRPGDGVATQAGSVEIQSNDVTPDAVSNDTIRQKYATNNLPEYEVAQTQGGEWMDYTRVFATNGSYNVYLRVANTAPQHVRFDLITGDTTSTNQTNTAVGPFLVPSTGMRSIYQYVPLTDAQGNLKTVSLSGTNTFRLTLADPASDTINGAMAMNYLVFVPATNAAPASVALQSAASLTNAFATETAAVIDTNAKTITIALPSGDQFYRLSVASGNAPKVTGVQLGKTNLVINYQ
ncbi:MAG: hypothetical protein KGS61_06010 [Verrucomicrobia bacterium]|nr:hypothetical protein [Verrucomicrobiota bacterium]